MSDTQMFIKFEALPNEILMDCFAYFHPFDLLYSFGQLNYRLEQLLQTFPLHLNFEDIQRKTYDGFCLAMLANPDAQQRVCSLRLSNRNTPGIIADFLLKFPLNQFSHLRSLTLVDVGEKDLGELQKILPKSSQIAVLHFEESKYCRRKFDSVIPIDNSKIQLMDSMLYLVKTTISIKSLTLISLPLDRICRLFEYAPLLQYFKVCHSRGQMLTAEHHQSPRPLHLKHLNLGYCKSFFRDLARFLRNMSNLRSLTIDSFNDPDIVAASCWERLITSSLPSLANFRFKQVLLLWWDVDNARRIFDQFQTNFWLQEHQWHTEYLVCTPFMIIYTIPYIVEHRSIPLVSERYCNPLFDNFQTFRHVKTMATCVEDVLKHGEYYFPNLASLILEKQPNKPIEHSEEMVASLMTLMSFSHLKHLEIPFDCRTRTPSLLFQILELAPQLSSLRAKPCFLQLLRNQSESSRYLLGKIRKLDISEDYYGHYCRRRIALRYLYQVVPNLEQLTMSLISIDGLFFLLDQFPKLSSFSVRVSPYDRGYERFTMQALKQNAFIHEEKLEEKFVNLSVWIRKDTVATKSDEDPKRGLSYLQYKFQRFMKMFEKKS